MAGWEREDDRVGSSFPVLEIFFFQFSKVQFNFININWAFDMTDSELINQKKTEVGVSLIKEDIENNSIARYVPLSSSFLVFFFLSFILSFFSSAHPSFTEI